MSVPPCGRTLLPPTGALSTFLHCGIRTHVLLLLTVNQFPNPGSCQPHFNPEGQWCKGHATLSVTPCRRALPCGIRTHALALLIMNQFPPCGFNSWIMSTLFWPWRTMMQRPCGIIGESLQARSPLWDSNPCSRAVNHESIPSSTITVLLLSAPLQLSSEMMPCTQMKHPVFCATDWNATRTEEWKPTWSHKHPFSCNMPWTNCKSLASMDCQQLGTWTMQHWKLLTFGMCLIWNVQLVNQSPLMMNRGSWHWQIVCSHNRCSPAGSLSLANRTGNRTHICFKLLWLRVVLCCQPSCWPWPFPFLNVDKARSPFAATKQTNKIVSSRTPNAQCFVRNHKNFTTEPEMSKAFNDNLFSRIKEICKENPSVSLQQLIETLQDLKTRFHNLLPFTGQPLGGAVWLAGAKPKPLTFASRNSPHNNGTAEPQDSSTEVDSVLCRNICLQNAVGMIMNPGTLQRHQQGTFGANDEKQHHELFELPSWNSAPQMLMFDHIWKTNTNRLSESTKKSLTRKKMTWSFSRFGSIQSNQIKLIDFWFICCQVVVASLMNVTFLEEDHWGNLLSKEGSWMKTESKNPSQSWWKCVLWTNWFNTCHLALQLLTITVQQLSAPLHLSSEMMPCTQMKHPVFCATDWNATRRVKTHMNRDLNPRLLWLRVFLCCCPQSGPWQIVQKMPCHTIGVPLLARSSLWTEPGLELTHACSDWEWSCAVNPDVDLDHFLFWMLTKLTVHLPPQSRPTKSSVLSRTPNAQCFVRNHKSFTTELEMTKAFNDDLFSRIKEIWKENPSVSLQQLIETLQESREALPSRHPSFVEPPFDIWLRLSQTKWMCSRSSKSAMAGIASCDKDDPISIGGWRKLKKIHFIVCQSMFFCSRRNWSSNGCTVCSWKESTHQRWMQQCSWTLAQQAKCHHFQKWRRRKRHARKTHSSLQINNCNSQLETQRTPRSFFFFQESQMPHDFWQTQSTLKWTTCIPSLGSRCWHNTEQEACHSHGGTSWLFVSSQRKWWWTHISS